MTKICNYCGYVQENDEDNICECGGTYVVEYGDYDSSDIYSWNRDKINAQYDGDFYYSGCNNIDNILECKRSRLNNNYKEE